MTTWEELRETLGLPLNGEASELVRRATAPERHAARIQATVEAARATGNPEVELVLDLLGTGGRLGCGGHGTVRREAFRGLGKGRWQATDGGAYRAAAEEGLRAILDGTLHQEFAHVEVEISPDIEAGHLTVGFRTGDAVGFRLNTQGLTTDAWVAAAARRGLINAVADATGGEGRWAILAAIRPAWPRPAWLDIRWTGLPEVWARLVDEASGLSSREAAPPSCWYSGGAAACHNPRGPDWCREGMEASGEAGPVRMTDGCGYN